MSSFKKEATKDETLKSGRREVKGNLSFLDNAKACNPCAVAGRSARCVTRMVPCT